VRAVLRNPDKAKHWFNLGCQVDIAEMEDGAPFIESDLDADSDIASGPSGSRAPYSSYHSARAPSLSLATALGFLAMKFARLCNAQ
jgi:hypothetical protein